MVDRRFAHCRFAFDKLVCWSEARAKIVHCRFVFFMFEWWIWVFFRFACSQLACSKSVLIICENDRLMNRSEALVRSVLVICVRCRLAFVRLAPLKLTLFRCAFFRMAFVRLAPIKLTLVMDGRVEKDRLEWDRSVNVISFRMVKSVLERSIVWRFCLFGPSPNREDDRRVCGFATKSSAQRRDMY